MNVVYLFRCLSLPLFISSNAQRSPDGPLDDDSSRGIDGNTARQYDNTRRNKEWWQLSSAVHHLRRWTVYQAKISILNSIGGRAKMARQRTTAAQHTMYKCNITMSQLLRRTFSNRASGWCDGVVQRAKYIGPDRHGMPVGHAMKRTEVKCSVRGLQQRAPESVRSVSARAKRRAALFGSELFCRLRESSIWMCESESESFDRPAERHRTARCWCVALRFIFALIPRRFQEFQQRYLNAVFFFFWKYVFDNVRKMRMQLHRNWSTASWFTSKLFWLHQGSRLKHWGNNFLGKYLHTYNLNYTKNKISDRAEQSRYSFHSFVHIRNSLFNSPTR